MSNIIQQTILDQWTRNRTRTSPSGWISANAVCCHHNGHNQDRRGRGGIIASSDGSVSYSCFNCGFTAHYRPGRALYYKMRKLLSWLGIDESKIRFLILESIRLKETATDEAVEQDVEVRFDRKELPEGSLSFSAWAEFFALKGIDECPTEFLDAVDYVSGRAVDMTKYDFYWTNDTAKNIHRRVIVPFNHQKEIVGYSGRSTVDWLKPKYYMETQPGYVFNIDQQQKSWRTVVVCEGLFDALSIDGVAVMHNEISELQADQIDSLGRDVIVVPDWDASGQRLVDLAIEYNWSVSFPVWNETCKDINDAVIKYGKLFVLKTILDSAEYNSLKVKLLAKKTRWNNA